MIPPPFPPGLHPAWQVVNAFLVTLAALLATGDLAMLLTGGQA